jgi:hypothetical protein
MPLKTNTLWRQVVATKYGSELASWTSGITIEVMVYLVETY